MTSEEPTPEIDLPESLPDLKILENYLKCGICYEFMTTALITPCSHNFCSICIRKFMQYRTSCPQCLASVNDIELKNNRTLDEMVAVMKRLRGPLCQALRGVKISVDLPTGPPPDPAELGDAVEMPCPKSPVPETSRYSAEQFSPQKPIHSFFSTTPTRASQGGPSGMRRQDSPPGSPVASQSRPEKIKVRNIFNMIQSPSLSPKKSIVVKESTRKVVMVNCPICQVEIPEANINVHIDRCLERSNQEIVAAIKPAEKKQEGRRRLPKLVYELMKDAELKKKLAELRLSTSGDKKTLIRRHKRYTLLYNSECDSMNPRPASEIVRQSEKEEREETKANSKVFKALQVDRKAKPEVIETAQVKYKSEHKSHFDKLVAELRERQKSKKPQEVSVPDVSTTPKKSVELDDPSNSSISSDIEEVLEPVVVLEENSVDSPGTPNSEMDELLSQMQRSPVIMRRRTPLAAVAAPNEEEEDDSLEALFSQPICSSSESKKGSKRRKKQQIESDSDDDIWDQDAAKPGTKRRNSQTSDMPLRRSSRKRKNDSVD